jgi:hypothetical protein
LSANEFAPLADLESTVCRVNAGSGHWTRSYFHLIEANAAIAYAIAAGELAGTISSSGFNGAAGGRAPCRRRSLGSARWRWFSVSFSLAKSISLVGPERADA